MQHFDIRSIQRSRITGIPCGYELPNGVVVLWYGNNQRNFSCIRTAQAAYPLFDILA